jgi:GNAT superfamily N-acetyltransferase
MTGTQLLAQTIACVEEREASEVTDRVREGLARYNEPVAGPRGTRSLVLSATDSHGDVIGGLTGKTFWNALHIELLWVSEASRSHGCGRRLVEAAENEALARGAEVAYVTTLSFQAPGFYEQLGYRKFGELAGVPKGASRLWYCKELSQNAV